MLNEAIRYLYDSDDVVVTVVIGGVLTMFSVLLIPWFLVLGYILRVIERTSHGSTEPPVFDEWGDMLVEGLKAFVITFVYGLIPAILGMIIVAGGLMGIFFGDAARVFGAIGLFLGFFVWLILTVVIAYIIPAALANFVDEGRIGAGFDFGTLQPILTDRPYAIGWLTAAAVIIIGWVVAGIIGVVPLIGWLVAPFVVFYFQVAAFFVIGQTWADVRPEGTGSVETDSPPVAPE